MPKLAGVTDLTVDFSQLEYISSAGLRLLLTFSKHIAKVNGTFKLIDVNENALEILEVTGFADVFNIE